MLTNWAVILWENAPKGHPLGHTLGHPLGPIPFRKPSGYGLTAKRRGLDNPIGQFSL